MAKHKFITMLQRRLRYTWKFCYRAIAKRLRKLLRPVFAAFNRRSNPRAGFVLPTAALLLLVVSLVVGAILIRTFNRTEQVVNERQEKVIYNEATPAIDRAKAKIEYLFSNDPRLPSGVPSEDRLWFMMLDQPGADTEPLGTDPYTLPDETRLNINGNPANAWSFRSDSDGDGEEDITIAYSIMWRISDGSGDVEDVQAVEELLDQKDAAVAARAKAQHVRNGPFSSEAKPGCEIQGAVLPIEKGWFRDPSSSAILRKNFQINAFAISNTDDRGTVTTLEFQQDRQADRGNKWGAWFRYDLEIAPGQPFKWNGAMHSDGSLIVGQSEFRGYLISAPDSCLYQPGPDTSEITLAGDSGDDEDAFQGQMMSANMNNDRAVGSNFFHIWDPDNPIYDEVADRDQTLFDPSTDSVQDGIAPSQIALDPIALFTLDESKYRGNVTKETVRDTNVWDNSPFVQEGAPRIYNAPASPLLIDDFYRADDRFGPKPVYGADPNLALTALGVMNGDDIAGAEPKLTNLNPIAAGVSSDSRDLGLDGYWERRAWREGMRVLVGQRLELGNDPLPTPVDYRGEGLRTSLTAANSTNTLRKHETLQRRALRDNPASVQTTAIYHYAAGANDGLEPPVAAIVSTVHPGTAETLKRSSIFENLTFGTAGAGGGGFPGFGGTFGDNNNEIAIDFFTGRGTNGWEIEFDSNYFTGTKVTDALNNLANFSGDIEGAFPPVQAASGQVIHPYPELTKWGNFSNLKRALQNGNGSIADESYKHTAALTMGMLAYNLTYLEAYTYPGNTAQLQALDSILENTAFVHPYAQDAGGSPLPPGTAGEGLPLGATPEDYLAVIAQADPTQEPIARLLQLKEQTNRDRSFGFRASPISNAPTAGEFKYDIQSLNSAASPPTSFIYGGVEYDLSAPTATPPTSGGSSPPKTSSAYFTCDFSTATGNNYFGFGKPAPGAVNAEKRFIRLATTLCGVNEDANGDGILTTNEDLNENGTFDSVKYPSLFYLFPKQNHDRKASGLALPFRQPTHTTSTATTYPADRYLTDTTIPNANFVALEPEEIILLPKEIGAWNLPKVSLGANPNLCGNEFTTDNPNTNCGKLSLIYDQKNDEYYRVAFKDSAFFNGREMMNVRALNLDLELLKDEQTPFGDFWLAGGNDEDLMDGGIVYAFREDAIREDAVARPAGGTCETFADFTAGNCESDVTDPKDPAVNAANGISPKPVDFYPDPDRRPYGFRLVNGEDISRPARGGQTQYGVTFVSDNPAYLQGDFNCHGDCDNPLEEFNRALDPEFDPDEFYGRRGLNPRFAQPNGGDTWRFSEMLVDAMTILSDNFCEGSIEDSFVALPSLSATDLPTQLRQLGRSSTNGLDNVYGCQNPGEYTSYLNQNRPAQTIGTLEWLRENPADPGSPIKVSANGNPETYNPRDNDPLAQRLLTISDYDKLYQNFSDNFGPNRQKAMNVAQDQRINSVIVSGIVPSQAGQTYGGLHNFPRFIEDWASGAQAASISGSLLQLNFSTYATGPFDQDAWEPAQTAQTGGPVIHYYEAPQRRWGYDVALQYAQPGPITTRLVTVSGLRSEYYNELPLDDPYVLNLRCAAGENGPIDPRAQENGEC